MLEEMSEKIIDFSQIPNVDSFIYVIEYITLK